MINWKELYSHIVIRKVRCNVCRKLFDEIDDVKVHLIKEHNFNETIKFCEVCNNPFVEIVQGQTRCGRQDCILYEKCVKTMEEGK